MVNQFTRQKIFIMLPDDALSRNYKEAVFKVTASTFRKLGVSKPLVANEFCDPLKSGALHNHFYLIFSKHTYCPQVDSKSGK